jgi:hypothetical protein
MKEIFRKQKKDKEEKKGPAEVVGFLSLVCDIFTSKN